MAFCAVVSVCPCISLCSALSHTHMPHRFLEDLDRSGWYLSFVAASEKRYPLSWGKGCGEERKEKKRKLRCLFLMNLKKTTTATIPYKPLLSVPILKQDQRMTFSSSFFPTLGFLILGLPKSSWSQGGSPSRPCLGIHGREIK